MAKNMNENLKQLMEQAQLMQKKMQDAQKELSSLVVTGEAGGGMVKITFKGNHDSTSCTITKSLFEDEDKEMIEDLVVAAINDANRKIEKESKRKISDITAGMNLPADLGIPGTSGDET